MNWIKRMSVLASAFVLVNLSGCGVYRWVFQNEADKALYDALYYNDLERLETALENGANIDELSGILAEEDSPLWIAATGRIDANQDRLLPYLLQKGADPNVKDWLGLTDLLGHYAHNTDVYGCSLLLKYGADNLDNALDMCVAHSSRSTSEKKILYIIDMLREHGATIREETWEIAWETYTEEWSDNTGDMEYEVRRLILQELIDGGYSSGLNPVLEAAVLGDTERFISLLTADPELPADDRGQKQLVFAAAAFGNAQVMQLLHEALSTDFMDDNGVNALMMAAHYGNLETMQFLLSYVDINAQSQRGKTALDYAVENEKYDAAAWILNNGFDRSLLGDTGYAAATNADIPMMELLTAYGYEYTENAIDSCLLWAGKWEPEVQAIRKPDGYKQVLDFFIEKGYIQDNSPDFPLLNTSLETLQYCMAHGSDVDREPVNSSHTALYDVCELGTDLERLHFLLENGADVNTESGHQPHPFYNLPLYAAISNGNLECVRSLIQYGADVNKVNTDPENEGTSLLMYSIGCGQKKIVKALLEAGADINHQNAKGETALIKAIVLGHEEGADILLDAPQIDTTIQDESGNTALDYAEKYHMSNIADKIRAKLVQET